MKDRHVFVRHGARADGVSPVPGHRRFGRSGVLSAAVAALLCGALAAGPPAQAAAQATAAEPAAVEASSPLGSPLPDVVPSLTRNLVAHYDFEHPVAGNPAQERDRGLSGTTINLVNGGAAMRVQDGAHPRSTTSMQAQQVNPALAGNDDWKAGIYSPTGVPSLNAFNAVQGTTVMGWFKMTGQNPSPNSTTADPDDFYGAIGLAGVLSGDSDGHAVRALLELIQVSGELRLVALGRRVDGSSSQTFAASGAWQSLLPPNEWVFLAATFDFDTGAMALYRNGIPLPGFYTVAGDPWGVAGPGPHYTSATDPRGIKIGGSFPQNTLERNPCNCRMDSLMFLDRAILASEVRQQYRYVTAELPR